MKAVLLMLSLFQHLGKPGVDRFNLPALLIAFQIITPGCKPAVERGGADPGFVNDPVRVPTITIHPVDTFPIDRQFTGELRARRASVLSFERTGRLETLSVGEGQRVHKDEVLASLNTEQLEAQKNRLVAEKKAARAVLAEMRAGPRKERIESTRSEIRAAEAIQRRAQLQLDRYQQVDERAVSKAQLDNATFTEQEAAARLASLKQQLEEMLNGTRQEQIDAQNALLESFQARVTLVEVQLSHSRLLAPYDGVTDRHLVDVGSVVSPGQPVLQLVEIQAMEAWVGIPIDAAAKLDGEQTYSLRIGDEIVGAKLEAVMPRVDDSTRTATVKFRLKPSEEGGFFPGQIVRLDWHTEVAERTYPLPSTALTQSHDGLWAVYQLAPEEGGGEARWRAQRVSVEVIHSSGDRVFVKGPLADGMTLVAAGVDRIVNGQSIAPVDVNPDSQSTQP